MDLTEKQALFVREYLRDLNAKQAAIRAGYSEKTAESQGSRLLSNAKVSAAVEKAMAERAKRVEVKADDVLRELMRIALCDIGQAFNAQGGLLPIHEMPEDVRRAIAGVDVDELWGANSDGDGRAQIGVTRKVKFWNKPDGLELLGKHLKLFTEKQEVSGPEGGALVVEIHKFTDSED